MKIYRQRQKGETYELNGIAKYDSYCRDCGTKIKKGQKIRLELYHKNNKLFSVQCMSCFVEDEQQRMLDEALNAAYEGEF